MNISLRNFAVCSALATLGLVGIGGLVTSHGVGMAVPDWPNTYGYNMFFFPISKWVGGVFYEHSHRLVASAVGLLTTILAVWLHGRRARPVLRWGGAALISIAALGWAVAAHRWADWVVMLIVGSISAGVSFVWPKCEPSPKWLRRLGLIALGLVIVQGVLGGLRVTQMKDEIGIFHATLAQLFFVLMCSLAMFTTAWWRDLSGRSGTVPRWLHRLCVGATLLIVAQLIIAASMRHAHAGLAIPDFPLAYGKLLPATDTASVALYNQKRLEVLSVNPITAGQIWLQMAHRFVACMICALVAGIAGAAIKLLQRGHPVKRLVLVWCVLLFIQFLLGAATIWSNKAADVATAHVVGGALSLAVGSIACIVSARLLVPVRGTVSLNSDELSDEFPLGPQTSPSA